MTDTTKPHQDFFLVDDEKEKWTLLQNAALTRAHSVFWTKGRAIHEETQIVRFFPDSKIITLASRESHKTHSYELLDQCATLGIKNAYLSFQLEEGQFFFHGVILGIGGVHTLALGPILTLYRLQRRKHPRATLGKVQSSVEFDIPLLQNIRVRKPIHDIAAGGISFITSQTEQRLYVRDTEIKKLEIEFQDEKFILQGYVRHVQPLSNQAKGFDLRVGLEFQEPPLRLTQMINRFVDNSMQSKFEDLVF